MRSPILGLTLLVMLAAPAAVGQDTSKPIDANDLVAILDPRAGPFFQADQIAAILHPASGTADGSAAAREAGAWGSGVLPDLHVRFEPGSATLAPSAGAQLRELAAALNGELLEPFRFEIRGHTDAAGSEEANLRLGQSRAEAVAARLHEDHAVPLSRVEAVGVGEHELARPDEPENALNRRVEVRTLD